MRHLVPAGSGEPDLAALYAWPEGPWVRANMVSSLDGAATGGDGLSGGLGGPADHEVFELLRSSADVVLVGAGTARAEGYGRGRTHPDWRHLRAGRAPHPAIAVVSGRGDLPPALLAPADDAGEVLLLTGGRGASGAPHEVVVDDGAGGVDLAAARGLLAARGLTRVLCEGGPHLLADVAATGRLGDLCLTLAPLLAGGSSPRITAGSPLGLPLRLETLLDADGPLLSRWSVLP